MSELAKATCKGNFERRSLKQESQNIKRPENESFWLLENDPSPRLMNVSLIPLLVPELFQHILDCLLIQFQDPNTLNPHNSLEVRHTLAALARTCRALSEPSLDRLWRQLHSLKPLIRCCTQVVDVHKTTLSPAEWTIINRCSHRVWKLTVRPGDGHLVRLFAQSQVSSLCSNLRMLTWTVSYDHTHLHMIAMIHQLLCPSLVSLSVFVRDADDGIKPFLENYPLLCPRLKSISFIFLHPENIPRLDTHQLSRAICSHPHLERLVLSAPVDDVALRRILLFPDLKVVSLMFHPKVSKLANVSVTSADTPFCSVKALELVVRDLHFFNGLLRPRDQMFRTLRLRLRDLPEAKSIFVLLNNLVSPPRIDSLHSIYLTFRGSVNNFDAEVGRRLQEEAMLHCLTYETLQPLASLGKLRQLEISLLNQTFLNDDEWANLARCWTMLEVLVLDRPALTKPLLPSTTLQGLLFLLIHCPRLRRLELSLDAREVPENTDTVVRNTLLTSLQLSESPIRDARPVAEFLLRHLPSMERVDATFTGIMFLPPGELGIAGEYRRLWAEVGEYVMLHYQAP